MAPPRTRINVLDSHHLPLPQGRVGGAGGTLALRGSHRGQQLGARQLSIGVHSQGQAQLAQRGGLRAQPKRGQHACGQAVRVCGNSWLCGEQSCIEVRREGSAAAGPNYA